MRRRISSLRPLWLVTAFAGVVLVSLHSRFSHPLLDAVPPLALSSALFFSGVLFMINPKTSEHDPHVMAAPVRGRWVALNTPGQQLPSHGTRFLGQYSAVDILLPSTPETPVKVRRAWRSSRPQEYPSFGEPVCIRWPTASSFARRRARLTTGPGTVGRG